MNPLTDLIRAVIEKICAQAGLEYGEIADKVTEDDVNYAELLCQSLLGGFLEYGWNNGAKFDTPAIRVALMYTLYAGMIVKKYENEGKNYSVEELFAQIDANNGISEWAENALSILQINADFKKAAKFTALVDSYVNYAADGLPQKIASGEDAVICVCACVAMFMLGKYNLFDLYEK